MVVVDSILVGIPKAMGRNTLSSNAKISVIGYVDNGAFTPLSDEDKKRYIGPSGEVFAVKFFAKYPKWLDTVISFYATPNNNEEGIDRYVWNFKEETCAFGYEAKVYAHGCLSQTDSAANAFFIKQLSLNQDDIVYSVCDNYLYRITDLLSKKGFLECWDMNSNEFQRIKQTTIYKQGDNYIILKEPSIAPKLVDKMSDGAIMAWFLKLAGSAYPEIADIIKQNQVTINKILPLLEPLKIPQYILNNRLRKVFTILDNISVTKDQLEDLATSPIFKDLVDRSVEEHKSTFIEEAKQDIDDSLKEYSKVIEAQKEELSQDVSKQEAELARINKEIERAKKEYSKQSELIEELAKKKNGVVADFQVIKEVLTLGQGLYSNDKNKKDICRDIEKRESEESPFDDIDEFRKRLGYYLAENHIRCSTSIICELLANNRMILVPDVCVSEAIVKATGRCSYMIDYVGVEWKDAGPLIDDIIFMSEECEIDPSRINYIILQNVNLSYMPCYLQPLLDILSGLRTVYQGKEIVIPDNLIIIGSITSDEGLPLSESCLKRIGCYPKNKINEVEKNTLPYVSGYLSIDVLRQDKVTTPENYYEDYLDE